MKNKFNKQQVLALFGIGIMVASSLGYAFMSARDPLTSGTPAVEYTYIPGIDLTELPEAGRAEFLQIVNTEECTCGCGFGSLAACRNLDPTCPQSPGRVSTIFNEIKSKYESTMDPDEDGLTTAEERTLGTNPDNADTDGDGLDDKEEQTLGTDPLTQETYAGIAEAQVQLALDAIAGKISQEEFETKDAFYTMLLERLKDVEPIPPSNLSIENPTQPFSLIGE